MKKVTSNKLFLFCILFFAVNFGVKAQNASKTSQDVYGIPVGYVFSADSLIGFDENSAKQGAFNAMAYGDEYKVYMYAAKRNFIDAKYKLIKPVKEAQYISNPNNSVAKYNPALPSILAANCQNEDFEEGSQTFPTPPATITVPSANAVNGWTINGGSNSSWGSTGNCTNTSAITGAPNPVILISPGAAGHLDPVIGASYRIWSVFGPTTTSYPAATTAQTPTFQCYGDWFIKLNNSTPGSSVNRMRKLINVTPANALFQFAFITVLQTGHCCCDNGSFNLKVKTFGPGCTGAG